MPRVSGTFKQSTKGIVAAYAHVNGISFSEGMEILAAKAGLEWFDPLPKSQKKKLIEQFNIFKKINN